MLATVALASMLALPPQAVAPAPPAMSVRVEAAAEPDAAVREWARELKAALAARPEEFRLATQGEKAELLVRLESVGKAKDGTPVLNGALALGATKRPFAYGFKDVKAQAEALARNLRKYADQMKAAPPGR